MGSRVRVPPRSPIKSKTYRISALSPIGLCLHCVYKSIAGRSNSDGRLAETEHHHPRGVERSRKNPVESRDPRQGRTTAYQSVGIDGSCERGARTATNPRHVGI